MPESQSPNLQCTSRLFHAPIEIRHAIYTLLINTAGIHITHTKQGEIRLSPCVGPNLDANKTGGERRPPDGVDSNSLFGRRVASSWGPHWECEEIALRNERNSDRENEAGRDRHGAVLRICKRVHLEFMELITKLVCFHINDLATLNALSKAPGISAAEVPSSALHGFENSFLPRITKLAITMRLPLPFFEALDGVQANEDDPTIWPRAFLRVTQLEALRSLRIWLDHSDKAYWAVVNERAILSRLELLVSLPYLDLSFDLPKLHPKLEDPKRHYIEEDTTNSDSISSSPFKIRRRMRQRYYAEKNAMGNYSTNFASDFPFFFDAPRFEFESLEEMERYERDLWRLGVDVERNIAASSNVFVHWGKPSLLLLHKQLNNN